MATEAEIAWAAGFYEGEGTFFVRRSRGRDVPSFPNGLVLTICQHNEEPLLKFHGIFNLGHIYGRIRRGKHVWWYSVSRTTDALHIAELMWPLLSERRQEQILDAVDEFASVPHVKSFDWSFFLKEVNVEGRA